MSAETRAPSSPWMRSPSSGPFNGSALIPASASAAVSRITIRLTAALADAGIRALPLKGPLLGERIHGELGARVSADIDLLVAGEDLVAAIEVLSTLGYGRA